MSEHRLTTASYLVLGLVEFAQPVTPYELKQLASISVMRFWALPHTQIYTQCDRLTEAGLLSEVREDKGRRRRKFSITTAGKKALDAWREDTTDTHLELRDTGLLKLFFGADPAALAEHQLSEHAGLLEIYEEMAANPGAMTPGMKAALNAGINYERTFIKYWESLRE